MFASNLKLSHPKLPLYTARVKNTIDLALIKVVAHRQNPSQNPLPADPKSLERAFNDVFAAIPKRKQDDAMEKFQSLLSPTERTRVYGDLGQVNFASATSVVDQVKALPLPAEMRFAQADVTDLQKQIMAKKIVGQAMKNMGQRVTSAVGSAAAAPQQAVASSMSFDVVSATCIKPNDIRKDEISMAVGTVDGVGTPLNAGPFFVGEFKKGDEIDLGATGRLFTFKLDQTVFPATFPAFAFMIESDVIHDQDLAAKLAIALAVTAGAIWAVSATILGLGLAGLIPAPAAVVAVVITLIAALAFSIAGTVVVPILADDISFANGDTLILDTVPAPGSVFERNVTIGGFGTHARGQYNVLFRWSAVQ